MSSSVASRSGSSTSSHGRYGGVRRHKAFTFSTGNLVLVKWDDGMVYFAKIKRIDQKRGKCIVVFDDKSQDEANFSQIHSVDETTTDIICIKCKKDDSDSPNEIVLCDKCGIGFHQKCHSPPIPASALQLDMPWNCSYCQRGIKCPYLTESLDVLHNLISDDNESTTCDEEYDDMESEAGEISLDDSSSRQGGLLRKRKGKKSSTIRNAKRERRKSLRHNASTPELSSLATVERKTRSITHANESKEGVSPTHTPLTSDSRSPSNDSIEILTTESTSGRKRKKHTNLYQKRMKRSSVESRTVSVTRVDTPIYADSSKSLFLPLVEEHVSPSKKESTELPEPETNGSVNVKAVLVKDKLKQRRFRVSLSLPDDSDKTPPSSGGDRTPPWDLIVSPKKKINSPSVDKNISESSKEKKHTKETVEECVHAPFVASPLPNVSLNQLGVTTKTTVSMDVGVSETKMKSPTIVTNPVIIASTKVPRFAGPTQSVPKCVLTEDKKEIVDPEVALHIQPPTTADPDLSKEQRKDDLEDVSKKEIQSPLTANLDMNKTLGQQSCAAACKVIEVIEVKVVKKGIQSPTATTTNPNFGKQVYPVTVKQPAKQAPAVKTCSSSEIKGAVNSELQICTKTPDSSRMPAGEVNPEVVKITSPESYKVDPSLQSSAVVVTPSTLDFDSSQRNMNSGLHSSTMISGSSKMQGEVKLATPSASTTTNLDFNKEPVDFPKATPDFSKEKVDFPKAATPDFSKAKKQSNSKILKQVVQTTTTCPPDSSKPEKQDRAKELSPIKPKQGHVYTSATQLGIQSPLLSKTNPLKVIKPRPSVLPFEKKTSSKTSSSIADIGGSSMRTPVITATLKPQLQPAGKKRVSSSDSSTDTSASLTSTRKSVLQKYDATACAQGSTSKTSSPVSLVTSTSTTADLDVIITGIENYCRRNDSKLTPHSRDARPKKKAVDVPQLEHSTSDFHKTTTPVADKIVCTKPPPPQTAQLVTEEYSTVYTTTTTTTPASTRIRTEVSHSPGASVYYSPDSVIVNKPGSHVSNVATTKPYAIVNALPAEVGYRPIAVHQKPSGSKQHLMQVVSSNGVMQLVARDVFQDGINGSETVASPILPPPPTYSMFVADKKKSVVDDDVQSIQKKIGDAFSCSSETMLISAFEDAWGKFQANGKKYNKKKSKTIGNYPEVVQQISTKPRLVAPKPSVKSSGPPVNSSPQYIHAAITPTGPSQQQQQLVFHSIPQEYDTVYASIAGTIPGSSHQVHSAGLFYPASAVEAGSPSEPHSLRPKQALQPQQRVISGQQNQQVKVTTTKPGPQGKVVRKSTKQCARCGDNATFLCSGCEVEWYCGRDCQLKAWEVHADHCKA